jgi:hypothetical protein
MKFKAHVITTNVNENTQKGLFWIEKTSIGIKRTYSVVFIK